MNNMNDYRPVRSVAEARNETEREIKGIIRRHHIPCRKIGKLLYVDVHKLNQYLAEVERKPRPQPAQRIRRDWNGRY